MQRSTKGSGLAILLALAFLAAAGLTSVPGASAQLPPDCFECSVELETISWNSTGLPGAIVGGIFELSNEGNGQDSFKVHVATDDDRWVAEAEIERAEAVPPGSGLFASDDNAVSFRVNVLVPSEALAGASTSITVTVTSESDASATTSRSGSAIADQFYAWSLECTPEVTAEKTEKAIVELTAVNAGNGPDSAEVTSPPLAGLAVTDVRQIQAEAGQRVDRVVELGIGLRLDDGDYTLRWDLRSASGETTSCTTRLTVIGGQPTGDNGADEGETNDSPMVAPVLLTALLLAMVATMRRRRY